MKIVLRILLLAGLAALGVWLWTILFPGPEKVIRQRLVKLARTASFSATEGNLARLAGAQKLAGFFATNVQVNVEVPGRTIHTFRGREEITQAALAAEGEGRSLKVTFPDINVTVAPDKQSAVADLTLLAHLSGQPQPIVQEMKFTLLKADGAWLISRVETVRTLSQ